MTKQEVTERMCKLIMSVGAMFDHKYAYDCICGKNPDGNRIDEIVIEYIETAVKIAMQETVAENNLRQDAGRLEEQ